jgi:hypothetical protein
MQKSIEAIGEFVVASCDTTELFEAIEKSFNGVTSLVSAPVDFTRRIAVASRRDDCFGARGFDDFDQGSVGVTSATRPPVRIRQMGLRVSAQA